VNQSVSTVSFNEDATIFPTGSGFGSMSANNPSISTILFNNNNAPTGVVLLNGGAGGTMACGSIGFAGFNSLTNMLIGFIYGDGNGGLVADSQGFTISDSTSAGGSLTCSNIIVSSVNGAAPGGGGGLTSSIQLGGTFVECANDGSEGIILDAAGDIQANTGQSITLAAGPQIQFTTNTAVITIEDSGFNMNKSISTPSIAASSITLQGNWPVPLFQTGSFTFPNAASNVVETDVIFGGTEWFASAVYDGAVNSAVSSIGTQILSRSTFALWAEGGLGVSWMALGN
jgi:hypothetical protein